MDFNKAFTGIWRKRKWSVIISLVVFVVVFVIALNVEIQHKREGGSDDEIQFFRTELLTSSSEGHLYYQVTLTNDQTYTIREVKVEFSGPELLPPRNSEAVHEENVPVGGKMTFSHVVHPGAVSMDITLEEKEQMIVGLTNIDLGIAGPNGTSSWTSSDSGNQEAIHLTEGEMQAAGYGEYIITVTHESGIRDVDFQLAAAVVYGPVVTGRSWDQDLGPGNFLIMDFSFVVAEDQASRMVCTIEAVVMLENGWDKDIERKLDPSGNIIDEVIPQNDGDDAQAEPWGPVDLTGTFSVLFILAAIVMCFLYLSRSRSADNKGKNNILVGIYLFTLLLALVLALDHTFVALQKDWLWSSPGMLFSYMAVVLLFCFTVYSLFSIETIEEDEKRKARWPNIVFIGAIVVTLVLHIGLMGDHLGFLK